jgi:hypothetical protein
MLAQTSVDDLSSTGCLLRRPDELRLAGGAGEEQRVGVVALGTGEPQREPEQRAGLEPRVGHVVPVPDPRHLEVAPRERVRPEPLAHREQVREQLAGVRRVGERIHDWYVSVRGHLLELGVGVGAHDHGVEVAGEDPRGVLHRLAAAELGVLRRQHQGVSAELVGGDLEGDARPRGRLLEDEPDRHPVERARPGLSEELPLGAALEELE